MWLPSGPGSCQHARASLILASRVLGPVPRGGGEVSQGTRQPCPAEDTTPLEKPCGAPP